MTAHISKGAICLELASFMQIHCPLNVLPGAMADCLELLNCQCKKYGISADPIKLEIYSENTLNLCLVDLPGLTKIPIGNQPQDIEARLERLISSYISNPNCIILAVVPANDDVANWHALKIASQHDPQRKRTLLVITKLDLNDRGTNSLELLKGNHGIPGPQFKAIVGVVNRCQADVLANIPMVIMQENLNKMLTTELVYKNPAKMEELMAEDEGTAMHRNQLTEKLNNLRIAENLIDEVIFQ